MENNQVPQEEVTFGESNVTTHIKSDDKFVDIDINMVEMTNTGSQQSEDTSEKIKQLTKDFLRKAYELDDEHVSGEKCLCSLCQEKHDNFLKSYNSVNHSIAGMSRQNSKSS